MGGGAELRIVPLGSSISLTVRQRGKAIYSVFFQGGSSSMLAVLATILMSEAVYHLNQITRDKSRSTSTYIFSNPLPKVDQLINNRLK